MTASVTTRDSHLPTVSPAVPVDPAERGTTTLATRVVEKIAAAAAREVPHCLGAHVRIAGIDTGRTAVKADAIVDGRLAGIDLAVAIRYPLPLVAATREVRRHVRDRVSALCGVTVDHVDLTVTELVRTPAPGPELVPVPAFPGARVPATTSRTPADEEVRS